MLGDAILLVCGLFAMIKEENQKQKLAPLMLPASDDRVAPTVDDTVEKLVQSESEHNKLYDKLYREEMRKIKKREYDRTYRMRKKLEKMNG